MTSYQRDMVGLPTDGFEDNVGKVARRRGKRTAPTRQTASAFHTEVPFLAPRIEPKGSSHAGEAASVVRAGHIPGYMGHVPVSRQYQFLEGYAQHHSHEKSFFLLPENYRMQMPGYTGRNMDYSKYSALCDRGRHYCAAP